MKKKTAQPPATATTKPAAMKPSKPIEPSQVPWPQVGPRGGTEVPKATQKKQGGEERKTHEFAIAALKAEKQQRLAELQKEQAVLKQNVDWSAAHPSEAANKGVQAQQAKVHAVEQRIIDIDKEIAARQAALAKLPK